MSTAARRERPMRRCITGVLPELLDVAVLATAASRRGKHRILGRDPSPASVLEERRNLFLYARGAQDPRVAPLNEDTPRSMLREIPDELDWPKLISFLWHI